jgi:tetratricopeptide (TPR) repeat protein
VSIRTLTGGAGAGKTRAAIELIERLNTEHPGQWWAGFVTGGELDRFAAQQNLGDWGWPRHTLVVVDYAGSLNFLLRKWLCELASNAAGANGKRLRLLLLEREAAVDKGWLQSLCSGGYSEAKVKDLFEPIEPQRLKRLDKPAERREILMRMLESAARLLGGRPAEMPKLGKAAWFDRQLESPVWGDPLYLMMAALLSPGSDMVELLKLPRWELTLQVVDHERKRLLEGVVPEGRRLLEHLAAVASLRGGITDEQALEAGEQEATALKLVYPGGIGALVERLHELLPAPDHGVAAVVPDIVGEALVLRTTEQRSSVQQQGVVLRAARAGGERVVLFILRTMQDFADSNAEAPLEWLEAIIRAGLADRLSLLSEIDLAMPDHVSALREKVVQVNRSVVERFIQSAETKRGEAVVREQSRLLSALSQRLVQLGRLEEALPYARKAVRIAEQLGDIGPDFYDLDGEIEFKGGGIMFKAYGWQELPLASVLDNLVSILYLLGRGKEALPKAQQAVQIYEKLATPAREDLLFDLAVALNRFCGVLDNLGRHEEALGNAQRALEIAEPLWRSSPQFLWVFAMSLANVGELLAQLGRHRDSFRKTQKARRICNRLVRANPDAFLPYLAKSLDNLGAVLGALGRLRAGLARSKQALSICEQLVHAQPEWFRRDVAECWETNGSILQKMERHAEAADSFLRGVEVLEPWFSRMPEASASLMEKLSAGYLQSTEKSGAKPNQALDSVLTTLSILKKSQIQK